MLSTLKIALILFSHLMCDPILPLIGLECFMPCNWFCCQFPSVPTIIHLEVKGIIVIIVRTNVLGVILPDEIVKYCKCRWNEGLDVHVVVRRNLQDTKAPLEDPEHLLNDIAS